MDFVETISHAETRGHGNPNEVRGRLQDQLNLFVAKWRYLEWANSTMQRRYGEIPETVKANLFVPYQARLICNWELSTQYRSKFDLMLAGLKQASHHVEAALHSWNLLGAEEVLMFASDDYQRAKHLSEDVQMALAAHEWVIQELLGLRDQLLCLEGAMDGLHARYSGLQDRYYNIDPEIIGSELVSPHAHTICVSGFDAFTFPNTDTLFGLQMEGLQKIAATGWQAVNDTDIENLSQALRFGNQSVAHVQVYLTDLESAVVEFETTEFLARYNGGFADEQKPVYASSICASPIETTFSVEMFQFVVGQDQKRKGKVLRPRRDTKVEAQDEHLPTIEEESRLQARIQFNNTRPEPLIKSAENAICQLQGTQISSGKKLILEVDGVIRQTWNLQGMNRRFPADDLLEKPLACEDFEYDGANVPSYKDFEYIGPEEDEEYTVAPTLQHPRPRSLSLKSAVEKWINDLPDDVVFPEAVEV